jgi:hypothetical protein
MKKNILFLVTLALSTFSAKAQITMETADMPQLLDTFVYEFDQESFPDLGDPSDSAQTWDFSGLVADGNYDVLGFVPTDLGNAPEDFPNADMLHFNFKSQFGLNQEYIQRNETNLVAEGFFFQGGGGAPAQSVVTIKKDTLLKYPFTYGDSLESGYFLKAFLDDVDQNPNTEDTLEQTVTRSIKYDGFGTLKTAFYSYEVIRETEILTQYDTLVFTDKTTGIATKTPLPNQGGGAPGVDVSFITRFYAKEHSAPIFVNGYRQSVGGNLFTQFIAGSTSDFTHSGDQEAGSEITFTSISTGNPKEYAWDFGDGVGFSSAKDTTYTFETGGIYMVSLYASNEFGGSTAVKELEITTTTGISTFTQNSMTIYPNPVAENLNIESTMDLKGGMFIVADISGKTILNGSLNNSLKNVINLGSLSPGAYNVTVINQEGTTKLTGNIIAK